MRAATKEQTAFRFDPGLLAMMKTRAKDLGQSLNSYITSLAQKDLLEARIFPKVELPAEYDPKVKKFSGIMSRPSDDDLRADERLERIWNR